MQGKEYPDETRVTFAHMVDHLRENQVDLDQTQLTLGLQLRIDSAREKFKNNAAADALLKREYRQPFVLPGEADL